MILGCSWYGAHLVVIIKGREEEEKELGWGRGVVWQGVRGGLGAPPANRSYIYRGYKANTSDSTIGGWEGLILQWIRRREFSEIDQNRGN